MTGSELVAISRLIKATGKLIGEVVNSEEGQKVISTAEKGVSTAFNKSSRMIDSGFRHIANMDYKRKVRLLSEIQSRTNEDEGVLISDDEIKKLISIINNPENLCETFLRYLLILYAVRARGMSNYLKKLTETRLYIDTLYTGQMDSVLVNLTSIENIGAAIRIWIPFTIKYYLTLIETNEECIKKNKESKKVYDENIKKEENKFDEYNYKDEDNYNYNKNDIGNTTGEYRFNGYDYIEENNYYYSDNKSTKNKKNKASNYNIKKNYTINNNDFYDESGNFTQEELRKMWEESHKDDYIKQEQKINKNNYSNYQINDNDFYDESGNFTQEELKKMWEESHKNDYIEQEQKINKNNYSEKNKKK